MPDESPALKLGLSGRQVQTQEQQQALKAAQVQRAEMLAMPLEELVQTVRNELDNNPLLEEYEPGEEEFQEEEDLGEETPGEGAPREDDEEPGGEEDQAPNSAEEAAAIAIEDLADRDDGWREELGGDEVESPARDLEEAQKRHDFALQSAHDDWTLRDDLLRQFSYDLGEEYQETYTYLVDSLDDDGFLTDSPETMAKDLGVPLEKVDKCIALLQTYDPKGLGARDLRESLLLQLKAKGQEGSLAWRAIDSCLAELLDGHFPAVEKELKAPAAEILNAIRSQKLNLRPGQNLRRKDYNPPLKADVIVECDEKGELVVSLPYDAYPHVRINRQALKEYREMPDKDARAWTKDRLQSGTRVIQALRDYRATVLRVAKAIVEHQRDYLLDQDCPLQPLTQKKLAEELSLDPSTVSRTVGGRCMQTPRGLFKMGSFFSQEVGGNASQDAVKSRLRELVESEDRAHPLSDEALAEKLQQEGFSLARRTVVKYREELGIGKAAVRRREYAMR